MGCFLQKCVLFCKCLNCQSYTSNSIAIFFFASPIFPLFIKQITFIIDSVCKKVHVLVTLKRCINLRRYKASFYNFIARAEQDTIVFNSRNCALVKVNNIFTDLLEEPNKREFPDYEEMAQRMFDAGFLVDETVDELLVLEHEHNEARFSKEKLTLSILTTFDCNFRCFYCFETKKAIYLTSKEIDGIKKFTSERVNGIKELDVVWFGGEPLLNAEPIWSLSEYFIQLAKNGGFKYNAFMISNGSLINDSMIEKIKESQINSLQITIDGDRETHNKRRFFADGRESYDVIINNIRKLTKNGIKVICRINLDKSNYDGAVSLINSLGAERLNNLQISFGHLLPLGGNDGWCAKLGYSVSDFSKVSDELADLVHNAGLSKEDDYSFYPRPKANFCGASQTNSFVIHPNGDLYKCFDSTEHKIGNVFSGLYKNDIEKCNSGHWLKFDPFNDEDCKLCKVLPLCMGGCPYIRDRHNNKLCVRWKDDIEKVILKRYYSQNKSR